MASSDEEGEIIPDCVTNYHFVDHKDGLVSFSNLPLLWSEDTIPDCSGTQIFLRGTTDGGLQVIYKKVISWKFELSYVVPEFYVLSKDKVWIRLQQPRKSYVSMIKTSLVTVHCLHFLKRNPGTSRDDTWNHLLRALSSLDVDPSENDLLVHKRLIMEAVNRDKDIAKSEYLAGLLEDMREDCTALCEDNLAAKKSNFIVAPSLCDSDNDGDNGDETDENILFDSVCSFCDNGGDILCCEGRCMRSFHATEEAGIDTLCVSLGYSDAQVAALETFLCKNCQFHQHQCFACGFLGSSNMSSKAEVFPCVSATCGRFYHPKCVSKLLHPRDGLQANEVEKKIADGDSYICPVHKCSVCKQGEDIKIHDLQFAVCRRCPKAYHRKCLPRSITFEFEDIEQRAWDDLLPKRILIYCMDHKIVPELGTPERNHIVFPGIEGKQQKQWAKLPPVEMKEVAENYVSRRSVKERASMQLPLKSKKTYDPDLGGTSFKKVEKGYPVKGSVKRTTDVIMKARKVSYMHPQVTASGPSTSLKRESLTCSRYRISLSEKPKNENVASPVTEKVETSRPPVDVEMQARIMALIERSTASFDKKEFIKKQKSLSDNSCSTRNMFEKTITRGKVEASVKAVQAALKKLEGGCTIEEAKEVCEPQVLKQIFKWKNDLSFYLAPFLHGKRYTSFGRHFTNEDKLKEIVDRLHWYVQDGDMIVDFCCGSNDFSCLLKEKLQQMGKSCLFKNYDIIQTKNDFNFEKRDWMSVSPDELPAGSQLIMGLNPPFGALGVKAYKFVKKALSFRPKLLILIVPRETRRPDANYPYDLVWEDDRMLAGKSFHLPGSVDVHDQRLEQWNLQAPPLYLWSRQDWTAKYRMIAQKHGHINDSHRPHVERKQVDPALTNYLMEENQDCFGDFSHIVNDGGDISRILDDVQEDSGYMEGEGSRSSLPREDVRFPAAGGWRHDQNLISHSYYDPNIIQDEGNRNSGQFEAPLVGNPDSAAKLETDDTCMDMELCTPTNSP